MGFRFQERVANIRFDETTPFAGATATLSLNAPMEMLFKFMAFSEDEANIPASEKRATFKEFGDLVLREWNLERADGTPYPASGEGLIAQPGGFKFAGELMSQWIRAANADDAPLEGQSSAGNGLVVPLAQTGTE